MENDFNDTLGAGSYPEPPEEKEKKITGKIVITYDLDEDIDIDFYGVEEFD